MVDYSLEPALAIIRRKKPYPSLSAQDQKIIVETVDGIRSSLDFGEFGLNEEEFRIITFYTTAQILNNRKQQLVELASMIAESRNDDCYTSWDHALIRSALKMIKNELR